MVDVVWLLIGFVVGVVAAAFAVELGRKKFLAPPDRNKLTHVWTLTELPAPLILTTGIEGVAMPRDSHVLIAGRYEGPRDHVRLRVNPDVQGNFAVDAHASRALLFLGGIRPGALALWTIDERLIERLRAEFNRFWSRSQDYVEHVGLAEVPQKANLTVQTEGTVQDILPYKGNYLLRLTDHGEAVGVLVDKDLAVTGRRVSVTGVVRSSSSGYPLIEAVEVKAAT